MICNIDALPVYPCVYREHVKILLENCGRLRFIPVYTGNIAIAPIFRDNSPVYPCVYREHSSLVVKTSHRPGLSLCIQGTCKNIIRELWQIAVYPCVYREHRGFLRANAEMAGLSLCVQGTSAPAINPNMPPRFIPVCTGNMCFHSSGVSFKPVYPCVYREHTVFRQPINWLTGLSLCVQGTLIYIPLQKKPHRFIPVCTGNMIDGWRLCKSPSGLSLCVQGTYRAVNWSSLALRFIPVCTGNMLLPIPMLIMTTVYPCVYREHNKNSTKS